MGFRPLVAVRQDGVFLSKWLAGNADASSGSSRWARLRERRRPPHSEPPSIAEAAERGWQVYASAPQCGGELPHLATQLTTLLNPALTTAQACLLAAAPAPG